MILRDKNFIRFVIIFAAVFVLFYYGALFLTGLAVPGGTYSPFAAKYLNVAAWLRDSLLYGTKIFLSFTGTETYRVNEYVLRAIGGRGIRIVYSCLGFGVMSFWIAYMAATPGRVKIKLLWLAGGLVLMWFINVLRLSFVLEGANKGWKFPLGWDHHTWFNIVSYLFIFGMIFFYHRYTDKYLTALK